LFSSAIILVPESSGKTTLCLHVIANAQTAGGVAAFIDAEHALDIIYAEKLGVDVENLLVSQPDTGEQALEIAEVLIRSGAVDVVVIDSVAALVPRAEIEGEMGDSHVGLQARLMSQALRKLTGAVNRSRTAVVFTNQIREKIGVMFGNPETQPGGRALKFYSSVRLDIRRIGAIKDGQELIGNRTRVKVVKNKTAPPFREAEFDIMYNEGISHNGLLIDLGVDTEVVDKAGAWFSYGDVRLGQGRENSKAFLVENPDIAREIEVKVRDALSLPPRAGAAAPAKDEEADTDAA
jgi:recombination protein RecA